jgi:hypothetical protein
LLNVAAQNAKITDILQTPQRFDLFLDIGNRAAVIAVVVENEGLSIAQEEKPPITHYQFRQAPSLRRPNRQ